MLTRELKSLPSTPFMVWMLTSSGFAFGSATLPGMIRDWSEHGRSIRYITGRGCCATVAMSFDGTSPGLQEAKIRSNLGRISAIVVAPTTISVAWLGLNQSRWKRTRWSRVILAVDSSVPDPVHGLE